MLAYLRRHRAVACVATVCACGLLIFAAAVFTDVLNVFAHEQGGGGQPWLVGDWDSTDGRGSRIALKLRADGRYVLFDRTRHERSGVIGRYSWSLAGVRLEPRFVRIGSPPDQVLASVTFLKFRDQRKELVGTDLVFRRTDDVPDDAIY